MTDLTVTLDTYDRSYKQKFLIEKEFVASEDDSTIRECIKEAKNNFGDDEPEKISIKISLKIR